ncbi:hypothetical protein LJC68_06175 [Bacteroidales bacterium OttesenSCG-928-B11]|nr:hypothetical protein [Bacteroidales bacterium OttesenSCG-928-B11]
MIHKICKQYSRLLEFGRSYTAAEFSKIILPHNQDFANIINSTKLTFTRSLKGIIIE